MGLFSGVKVVTILCSLIRNKLIAWIVGPAGLGLVILFNSIAELVATGTRLSIDQSAQRDISQNRHDPSLTVTVVRRWSLWMGTAGAAVMCLLSPLLSYLSFGNTGHWPVFCLLGTVPFGITVSSCSIAINQGLHRFRAVAAGTVTGALLGLAAAIPLVFWLKEQSIAWIVAAYGVAAFVGAWLFRARVANVHLPVRRIMAEGTGFVKLGFLITVATLCTQGASYIFVLFLNNYGTTSALGLYQAGYTLINTYVGVILTGIWMEYYPRLSAMAHSPRRMALAASHEVSIAAITLIPVLVTLIFLCRPIVDIIYASSFRQAIPYITICTTGVVLRAASWCLSFIILARGDGKAYVLTEISSAVIGLALNIAGYTIGGMTGLGMAYVLWYVVYTVMVAAICRRRYGIGYTRRAWTLICVAAAVTLATSALVIA